MIAVALGLIGLVVMIATGVAASSTADDRLTFLGIGVQTTTAQVFLTGAIFGWLFVIALWLLRMGVHRSGERCAQLAARRGRRTSHRTSQWLGFGAIGEPDDDGWDGWDEWNQPRRRSRSGERGSDSGRMRFRGRGSGAGASSGDARADGIERSCGQVQAHGTGPGGDQVRSCATERDGLQARGRADEASSGQLWAGASERSGGQVQARATEPGDHLLSHGIESSRPARPALSGSDSLQGDRPFTRPGATRDGRGAPWRPDGGVDNAHQAVAGAADQAGALGQGDSAGPVAWRFTGLGVDGRAQRRQVGGGAGAVAGEDCRAEGEDRAGEGRQ